MPHSSCRFNRPRVISCRDCGHNPSAVRWKEFHHGGGRYGKRVCSVADNLRRSRSTRKTRRTPSITAGVQLATQRSIGWYAASKCSGFVFLRCGKHHTTRIEGVQGAFVLSQGECVFLVLRCCCCCCCCCLHIKSRSDLYSPSVLSNIPTGPTDANAFRGHRLTTQKGYTL